ncbi:uncharacterized protein LOC141900045 isoform X3 [Tubulanus polymorphus]|uniref:uncharacterized protein LOC141900045 isoform X3 n=1 Tax=Tubulanus polymorphus TaxID=672921 RepID=UPI003DA68C28
MGDNYAEEKDITADENPLVNKEKRKSVSAPVRTPDGRIHSVVEVDVDDPSQVGERMNEVLNLEDDKEEDVFDDERKGDATKDDDKDAENDDDDDDDDECQAGSATLTKQESLSSVEKTKISSMFENIVNHSMVGGGTLSKAAITTQEGNIYANCPADFLPTVDQIQLLVNAVQDPNLIQADKGICLGDMSFMYKEGKDAESIYGITADGDGGCIIIKTKRCMMIGIYDKKADDARTLVEDLADYLCGRNL